jgi:hypothetical protein
VPAPRIVSFTVGDEPDSWRRAGFAVDDDGGCRVGTVRIDLVGRSTGKRIRGWTLRDVAPGAVVDGRLDGLRTEVTTEQPGPAGDHPNGAALIDHVVLATPNGARTVAAFEQAGWTVRGTRQGGTYGAPMRQTFFRAGEVIVELISGEEEPDPPSADPTAFFGLAFTVADLDGLAAELGDTLGQVKDAVQPGRRIATLRHAPLDVSVPVAFMSPEPGGAQAR